MKYLINVILEMQDWVEADSPEEAFEILSNDAMSCGDWQWDVLD
jgi:ABC-type nitrate/sulfonate/bicarbonate transport system substrate-binding protein